MSDIYLSLTETPAVVTLSQPVVSGVLSSNVTVTNVVSVNVVTMPAITVQAAAPAVTTVAGTVAVSNFPASSSVTIANFPSVTTVTGTVALDSASLIALENVTVTVGAAVTVAGFSTSSLPPSTVTVGNSVTIGNFPSTQTIAGTVTANVMGFDLASNAVAQIPVNYWNEGFSAGERAVPVLIGNEFGGYNFNNTLPISGTVTANVLFSATVGDTMPPQAVALGFYKGDDAGIAAVDDSYNKLPIAGTVTVGNTVTIGSLPAISGTVTANVGNSIIIGSLPAISGTVTANVANSVTVGSLPVQLSTTTIGGMARLNVTLSSATTVGGAAPSYANLHGGSDGTNLRAILTDTNGRTVVTGTVGVSGTVPVSGTFWQATQPVSLTSLPSLAAGTAQIGSVTASISGTVPVSGTVTANVSGTVPVSGTFWQATQPVSGTVTAAVASTTVTVSAMPSGTLTTRFGTPTTANTAFLTSAVTNTARKYLLIQNVTTASNVITVGVGFVPTTTQGIQLAAGAGITFESSYIPTGAVWVLSSVTASNHTILEA